MGSATIWKFLLSLRFWFWGFSVCFCFCPDWMTNGLPVFLVIFKELDLRLIKLYCFPFSVRLLFLFKDRSYVVQAGLYLAKQPRIPLILLPLPPRGRDSGHVPCLAALYVWRCLPAFRDHVCFFVFWLLDTLLCALDCGQCHLWLPVAPKSEGSSALFCFYFKVQIALACFLIFFFFI